VVGQDSGAKMLQDLFKKAKVSWDGMIVDEKRPTTRKTRVMAKHHHLVRVDYEVKKYLTPETENKVFKAFEKCLPQVDGVILEDYAKGVISPELISKVVQTCRQSKKPLFVDPHRNNIGTFYAGVDLIKPNYEEAFALAGIDMDDLRDNPDKVYEVGRKLQSVTGAKQIVITRGKEGMTIFSGDDITEVPTFARKVFDVTGAGDTVIAAMALGLVAGFGLVQACMLANFAAGVVVGKVGCVPCELQELKDYILR
jgi:rfaE bifunctional protein kinase chain/domain